VLLKKTGIADGRQCCLLLPKIFGQINQKIRRLANFIGFSSIHIAKWQGKLSISIEVKICSHM
jgi:hypothetical protein